MNQDEKLLQLQVQARAERLGLVRAVVKWAAETAGCSAALVEQLVIAVNEACMNVIQHAYGTDASGDLVLEVFYSGTRIRFRLASYILTAIVSWPALDTIIAYLRASTLREATLVSVPSGSYATFASIS